MLKILKGQSSKYYENEFFRKLAVNLSKTFERHQWDGILIGMPQCMTREDLQIDCLLVTDSQLIIIDFKNYSGHLTLPEATNFNKELWMIDDVIVKGGSAINPYIQIRRQRQKLIQELKKFLPNFNRKAIHTLVCFQDKVTMDKEVPRSYRIGFDIVDETTYQCKIEDIVDVLPEEEGVSFLDEHHEQILTETLFNAPVYNTQEVITIPSESKPLLYSVENNTEEKMREFLKSKDQVMIVTGPTRSGKTNMIPFIRDWAFSEGYAHVPVYAYSNRLRAKMLQYHPNIEDVDSLFGTLFDFNRTYFDDDYRKIIPLKNITLEDEEHSDSTVYIIDDSQLLSNSQFDPEALQFGTGRLIDDLFTYLDLANYPKRKIILMGDLFKIGYGSKEENILDPQFLSSYLTDRKIVTNIHYMALKTNTSLDAIGEICNDVAECIVNERYNYLVVSETEHIHAGDKQLKKEALEKAYLFPFEHKILTYTNEKAKKVNQWIKEHSLKNGRTICAEDYIVFNTTIEAFKCEKNALQDGQIPKRIDNGTFGKVIRVYIDQIIDIKSGGNEVSLTLIPCDVALSDNSIVTVYVLEEYLEAPKSMLSKEQQAAIYLKLRSLEKEAYAKEPFTDSQEFRAMQKDPQSYVVIKKENEILYRSKQDRRYLTSYEKAYRKRINEQLLTPTHLYFKLLNAARVRYAWAMTVNKAMAYKFENVYFDTDQGENRGTTNKDYFKWLYTGFSIANQSLSLINWKAISPFMNTTFEVNLVTSKKASYWFVANDDASISSQIHEHINKCFATTNWHVKTAIECQYLEILTITNGEEDLKLHVYYDGKNNVKLPKYQAGDEQIFNDIKSLFMSEMTNKITDLPENLQSCFVQLTEDLAQEEVIMDVTVKAEWIIQMKLIKGGDKAILEMFYNTKGLISKCYLKDGDVALFDYFQKIVKQTK